MFLRSTAINYAQLCADNITVLCNMILAICKMLSLIPGSSYTDALGGLDGPPTQSVSI